ncbi:protein kinase [Streptomyces aurantiacus]|uniref:non-specific serine/threonine protein kinase n=1 Tax=Streptomyces aurantiacus JA 4570 TaxID=1286094 RepID=S3ZAQ0_9ACTN|nr:protein kinase [Streptomyces aurantiacus]EPH40801.1 hypothetical protein STRAU_6125 [Streptomyces aurantiacus JA 4570]
MSRWRHRHGGRYVDPFAHAYFTKALRTAKTLKGARIRDALGEYEILRQVEGPHATVLVGRRRDGQLTVLKGFRPDRPVSPLTRATRHSEALRMMRFGYGGFVPLEDTLSLADGGTYLCMPYCQGGSLRDRLAAGGIGAAELAYHGLALACALQKLHGHGLVHGDVKPDNVLFHHGDDGLGEEAAKWHTWLSDLETLSEAGGPTSWRMTPDYAAPEQLGGSPAAPAMDVWAWGTTMREGADITGPPPPEWRWLTDLIDRARAAEPTDRPPTAEIIETYSRQVAFGDDKQPYLGAHRDTATAWYPLPSMPPFPGSWPRSDPGTPVTTAVVSFGWATSLPECRRLHRIGSVPALTRLADLCTRILGDPADPASVWQAFRDRPGATALRGDASLGFTWNVEGATSPSGPEDAVLPRQAALSFVVYLALALVELVESTGADTDVERLRTVAEAWESIGEFESEGDTAILAQAWLTVDEPYRALPYVRHSYAHDRTNPSALAAMRVYYLATGDSGMAAKVSAQACDATDATMALRWLALAVVDLLEAAEYDTLDSVLDATRDHRIDVVDLVRCVLAGRRGPVRADAEWAALREHCSTLSSATSIQKLRYLVEAAHQRGDADYARRCAAVALARPVIRLPIHHRARAALEAVALGRDPADGSLTARLNNRAELWAADGRPDDPLVGLCLVAAQRWVNGDGRTAATAAAQELVAHSRSRTEDRTGLLLRSTRHCAGCSGTGPVAQMSVCGSCHQLFCVDCGESARREHIGRCGGDLVRPPLGGE